MVCCRDVLTTAPSLMLFQVASTAHRLLALLAEGLGSGFQPYCRSVLGAMLVKLKDKKCVGVLGTCLDKVYGNPHSLDQVRDCPHPVHLRRVDHYSC